LAEKGIAVFLSPIGEMGNEGFDLLARGFAQGLCAAEVDGVGFHQFCIEFVPTNELAKAIANSHSVSVSGMAAASVGRRLWRELTNWALGLASGLGGSDFLSRAHADSICLAQRAIHGASLRDTHLSTAYEWRNVGRIGVAEPGEAPAPLGLENASPEYPPRISRVTSRQHRSTVNSAAPVSFSDF
jgi:hypothetical protein